jgi:hypothetical protein
LMARNRRHRGTSRLSGAVLPDQTAAAGRMSPGRPGCVRGYVRGCAWGCAWGCV